MQSAEQTYGKRAAKTYRKYLELYPIGAKVAHTTVTGLPVQKLVGRKRAVQWFIPLKCKCGKEFTCSAGHLQRGCGCVRVERFAAFNLAHGCCSHPLLRRLRAVHAARVEIQEHAARIDDRVPLESVAAWLQQQGLACALENDVCVVGNYAVAFDVYTPVSLRTSTERLFSYQRFLRYRENDRQLFTISRHDWVHNKFPILRWLRHKLGLTPRLCSARDCSLVRVAAKDAFYFYGQHHLQGPAAGTHFGLAHDGKLVACMTFSQSAPERKKSLTNGSFALVRLALAGSVPGAASRLFHYAVATLLAQEIVTYSDNSYATGDVYRKLGFTLEAQIDPDYKVWHSRFGLRHKSYWQRRMIPRRLEELKLSIKYDPATDARTEFDMEQLTGCFHVWDCGKKRWRWRRTVVTKDDCDATCQLRSECLHGQAEEDG